MSNDPHAIAPLVRRSLLYRWHDLHDARYEMHDSVRLVTAYGDVVAESGQAQSLGLCDLSLLGRCGFKGRGAGEWLAREAHTPAAPNLACKTDDDGLIARLSNDEYLLVDTLRPAAGESQRLLQKYAAERPAATYPLPRADSHCLFAMCGEQAAPALATLCGVDLRQAQFAVGTVAQTSLASINAIIVRTHAAQSPVYYLLSDVSAAEYLWTTLIVAVTGFGGQPVGVAALRALNASV